MGEEGEVRWERETLIDWRVLYRRIDLYLSLGVRTRHPDFPS